MARTSILIGLASLLLASKIVSGATLQVDQANTSCSDSGSGTSSRPFCTIGAAAKKAVAGTTVVVSDGDYPESVTVGSSGTQSSPIVFTTAAGATVTLTGASHGFTISGRSWITIDHFRVTKTSGDAISVANSSHVTIRSNHFSYSGHQSSGKTANGVQLSGVTDSLVSG